MNYHHLRVRMFFIYLIYLLDSILLVIIYIYLMIILVSSIRSMFHSSMIEDKAVEKMIFIMMIVLGRKWFAKEKNLPMRIQKYQINWRNQRKIFLSRIVNETTTNSIRNFFEEQNMLLFWSKIKFLKSLILFFWCRNQSSQCHQWKGLTNWEENNIREWETNIKELWCFSFIFDTELISRKIVAALS